MHLRLFLSFALFFPALVFAQTNDGSGAEPEDSVSLSKVLSISFGTKSTSNLPDSASLPFSHKVIFNQGEHCDCAYCACAKARSILGAVYAKHCEQLEEWTEFSYTYLRHAYNLQNECCTDSVSCCRAKISSVLQIMATSGIATASQWPNNLPCTSKGDTTGAGKNRISNFYWLLPQETTEANISAFKEAISKGNPLIVGITAPDDFTSIARGQNTWDCADNLSGTDYHAVVLIGYNKTHFQILNSYGADWGDNGTVWVPATCIMQMKPYAFVQEWGCP